VTELALLGAVTVVCASALLGLRMVLRHRARTFESQPVTELQKRIDSIESRLLAGAMRR
jgi:hypothetical protein